MNAYVDSALPETAQLLVSGGDARIALDPHSGLNRYGCPPQPDTELLAFASSTASVISPAGFAAAERLRQRVLDEAAGGTQALRRAVEWQRIRQALLSEVTDLHVELVFAVSGTDAHFMVARFLERTVHQPLTVVMVEADETGSGVAAALQGSASHLVQVALRSPAGVARPAEDVDAEVMAQVELALGQSRHVLLVMVDQSKTGLIAPSPACVAALHRRCAGRLDVLVDACQFRIAAATLRAYLQQGWMVAVTGSKFFTGPCFSAALLLPAGQRLRAYPRSDLQDDFANLGLLLRWEAALTEWQRFHTLPAAKVVQVMQAFAAVVQQRLADEANLALLDVPPLVRDVLVEAPSWDAIPSIFPFLLYHPPVAGVRLPFSRDETLQVYRQLQIADSAGVRCQFGQPVACGTRNGIPVSALRLCLSARLISDAVEHDELSVLLASAQLALDKAVSLIR